MKLVLELFLISAASEAFSPLPTPTSAMRSRHLALSSAVNEGSIVRLKKEYRDLQSKLFQDLESHRMEAARKDEEAVFEKAIDLLEAEQHQQEGKLQESEKQWWQAVEDFEKADQMKKKAHVIAEMEEQYEAILLESADDDDADSKDLKRLRILSEAVNDHNVEDGANDRIVDAQLRGLEAVVEYKAACDLLRELQDKEKLLKETLAELRKDNDQDAALQNWIDYEMPKHEAFLGVVRETMRSGKLIDHDPTKGNVAF